MIHQATRGVWAWLLPRYANHTLPGPLASLMRARLDHDAELAAAYDALRALERAAAQRALSPAQEEGVLRAVLGTVEHEPEPAPAARAPSPWLPALGAAAAVVAFVIVTPDAPVGGAGDLAARGDAVAPLGVRVRCVAADRVVSDASVGARQVTGALSCPDDGLLAFSLTNLGERDAYAFVIGISAAGTPVFVPPFLPSRPAVHVHAGDVDVVVDQLAPMPALDDEGLTLFVLVDPRPFAGDDVLRRLEAARAQAVPLGSVDRLPLEIAVQARLSLTRPARER